MSRHSRLRILTTNSLVLKVLGRKSMTGRFRIAQRPNGGRSLDLRELRRQTSC